MKVETWVWERVLPPSTTPPRLPGEYRQSWANPPVVWQPGQGTPDFSLLTNGNFQTGDHTGWTISGAVTVQSTKVHSADYAALLSGDTGPGTIKLTQSVKIPSGVNTANVSAWYWASATADSDEATSQSATVVRDTDKIGLLAVGRYDSQTWTHVTADVSEFIGSTISIEFEIDTSEGTTGPIKLYVAEVTLTT